MNSEIERAFVAAATPAFAPMAVVSGLTSALFTGDDGGLIVDASGENLSPVATLWRLPIVFRLDFPALIESADQATALRAASASLLAWLKDKETVIEAFDSEQIELLPNYHIGTSGARQEDDRLIEEITIVAGLREI